MKRLLCLLAILALCVPAFAAPKSKPLPRDSVYQLPVQLTDQDGKRFEWSSRRGKVQLVSMFYTSCQYICPLIVESGKAVERQLAPAERGRLGILLVSMDPKRDTPAALMSVVNQRKLDPNVEFDSGNIYKALKIPTEMFPVMFAIGRTAGWVTHGLEQQVDPEAKIGRPRQIYTGYAPRDYVSADKR